MAASANLLGCFWALSSTSDSERLAAAKDILEILRTKEDDLQYCVERLVRGLGSNRKGARQGFSIALTELLSSFPRVTAGQVLALVDRHLRPAGSSKVEEERGCLFGQVFALMCLLRSRCLPAKDGLRVLRQLTALSGRKAYLCQVCCVASGQALLQLSEGKATCSAVLGELSSALEGGWAACSPEALYLVLALEQVYAGTELSAGLKKLQWGDKPVMHEANLPALSRLLHGVTDPHHIVWPVLVAAAHSSNSFSKFWNLVVNDDLCQSSARHQCVALHMVELLLPDLASPEVHVVFSPNLLRCLASGLTTKDSDVNAAAGHLVRSMCEHFSCAHKQASRVAMVMQLIGRHGWKRFHSNPDVLSLLQLCEQIDCDDILEYLTSLLGFLFECEDDSYRKSVTESSLEQVSLLLQHPMMRSKHNRGTLVACACFLLLMAGFGGVDQPTKDLQVKWMPQNIPSSFDVGAHVSQLARQKLTATLTDIIRSGRAHSAELCFLPLRDVVLFAEALLSSGNHTHLALSASWDREQQSAWRSASLIIRQFSPTGSTQLESALSLLHTNAALHLLLDPTSKAAPGMVEELAVMQYDVAAVAGPANGASTWCEVLTDMLLSLLCQPSSLHREVASQAFRMTMPHQTQQSLDLLVAVVDPRRTEELNQFVMLNEEMDAEEGGTGGEGKELGFQMEEGSDSSEESDSSHNSQEVDQLHDFRDSLKTALGPAALEMDSGESPSDLSDDAMMLQDSALSAVLRSHLHSKGTQQRRKEQAHLIVNFQLRVLKLVEAFVKRQPSSPWLLDIIIPLVRLALRDQASLSPRATAIAVRICKGKVPGGSSQVALSALKEAMKLLYKVSSSEVSHVLNVAVMWLLKVVCHDGQESPAVAESVELFRGLLWDFVTKKNCTVSFGLFQALFQRHVHLAWLLISDVMEASAKAASSFRKVQCYQLMQLVVSGTAPDEAQQSHLSDMVAAANECVMEVTVEARTNSQLNKAQLKLVTEALLLLKLCAPLSSIATIAPSLAVTVKEVMQCECTQRAKLLQNTCSELLDLLRRSHVPHHSSSLDGTPKAKRKKHN